jgi:FlaA1/EpsC-like NDP-sugar epimerase
VIDSAYLAQGGEVFVTKMPVIRIQDLAEVMIAELGPIYGHKAGIIDIEVIGFKAGEKLYEELMSQEETRRTWELPDYFVVLPAFKSLYKNISYVYPDIISKDVHKPYHAGNEQPLAQDELKNFLYENGLLEGDVSEPFIPAERYWP